MQLRVKKQEEGVEVASWKLEVESGREVLVQQAGSCSRYPDVIMIKLSFDNV
jgi:hypothetical protein